MLFIDIFVCALTLLGVLWSVYRISNRYVIQLCRAIPSAQPSYPVLGNIHMFACSLEKMTTNVFSVLEKSVLEGHRAVCFWIADYPLVFVTDPHDIKKILNSSLNRGHEIEESSSEYSKYGLFTCPVDHWKITRRHLDLSFQPRHLQLLMPTFNLTSRRLVADISEHVDGAPFDLMPHTVYAALRAIFAFMFGQHAVDNISSGQFEVIKHGVELAAEMVALRVTRPWLRCDKIFKYVHGQEIKGVKLMCQEVAKLVSGEREQLKNEELNDSKGTDGEFESNFKTILNAMRELQNRFSTVTDQKVNDEMSSTALSGSDTIATSVSSCLLALARFEKIQHKVYEEICSVLSEDDEITYEDLKRLSYLDQVVKETLRFFTPAPATARAPTKEMDLGGYKLPANKTVILYTSGACLDPKYFPDPYRFDPGRFSEERAIDDDVFMPFSRGPRGCVGKEYAMMLIKVMVVHVIRKYSLSTNMEIQNSKKKFMLFLILCDGYNVLLTNRNK